MVFFGVITFFAWLLGLAADVRRNDVVTTAGNVTGLEGAIIYRFFYWDRHRLTEADGAAEAAFERRVDRLCFVVFYGDLLGVVGHRWLFL